MNVADLSSVRPLKAIGLGCWHKSLASKQLTSVSIRYRGSGHMKAPAGWDPTTGGRLRYWDGARWTPHFAVSRAPQASSISGVYQPDCKASVDARRPASGAAMATWLGWGRLCLVAPLGAASGGVPGLSAFTGTYVLVGSVSSRRETSAARSRGATSFTAIVRMSLERIAARTSTSDPPSVAAASVPVAAAVLRLELRAAEIGLPRSWLRRLLWDAGAQNGSCVGARVAGLRSCGSEPSTGPGGSLEVDR